MPCGDRWSDGLGAPRLVCQELDHFATGAVERSLLRLRDPAGENRSSFFVHEPKKELRSLKPAQYGILPCGADNLAAQLPGISKMSP